MALAVLSAALCTARPALAGVRVTDDTGREIVLPRPAVRVIALYGAFNEILDGLGRAEAIVARTNADTTPARIAKLPVIGTHMRPNIEAVLAQKPDLVLQMAGRKEASIPVDALMRHGVSVAVFRAGSFAELMSVIRRVGTLTGADDRAEAMVLGLQARLDAVDAQVARTSGRPRTFFEVRSPNMFSVGQKSLVTEIIRRAGGINCVQTPERFAHLSEEEVIRLAPEAYVIQRGPMNPAPLPLADRPRLRGLPATKSGRAWFVDEMKYSRPGPRNVDAVEELARLLHPEIARKPGAKDTK
ncbi:iron complex transport system substrate-binding protein [Humidesulfovibrio mexicanus]|uniref:Iron complex transport system substrate-binding protein n=1 Tax=Humidesulfovibrio mexicanus TaxID=147047 RepID=A0A239BIA4_9BACT|nr:iron complex transport system substrate-binding protein [Humidesulfovibrio mexicanus]